MMFQQRKRRHCSWRKLLRAEYLLRWSQHRNLHYLLIECCLARLSAERLEIPWFLYRPVILVLCSWNGGKIMDRMWFSRTSALRLHFSVVCAICGYLFRFHFSEVCNMYLWRYLHVAAINVWLFRSTKRHQQTKSLSKSPLRPTELLSMSYVLWLSKEKNFTSLLCTRAQTGTLLLYPTTLNLN